jgi:hypothetical protein
MRSNVRSVTDPFLLSAGDDEPPAEPSRRAVELERRLGLPRTVLDIVPLEVMEELVRRGEAWKELCADLRRTLIAAGFPQHDPQGEGGGFHIASHLRDDGVLVSWATRQYTSHEAGSFENTVSEIMQPALQAILLSCGFATQTIPEGLDYAGYLLVTGRTAAPA